MTVTPPAGRVVFLNGGSSSGTSTIGRALQAKLEGGWLLIGVDVLNWLLPVEMTRSPSGISVIDGEIHRGAAFLSAYNWFQHSVAALCRAGQNVTVDGVLADGGAGQRNWASSFEGIAVIWVGVCCSGPVAKARESDRGDRSRGVAGRYTDCVHQGVNYDIDVDTTAASVADSVSSIAGALLDRWGVASGNRENGRDGLPARTALCADGSGSAAPWER